MKCKKKRFDAAMDFISGQKVNSLLRCLQCQKMKLDLILIFFFLLIGRSIKQSLQAKVNKINMKDQTDTLPHKDRGTKKTNAAKTRVTTPHSFERIKGSNV